MDQEGHEKKIEEIQITDYSSAQHLDDVIVDKSVCRSSVVDLNDDAWLLVFDYLRTADRVRIARVCRRWRELAQTSWKSISRLSFESMFELPSKTLHNDFLFNPMTDNLLGVFLQKCGTYLVILDLSSIHRYLTPRALDLIGLYGTSLQELYLSNMELNKTALKTLTEKLPRLIYLRLRLCTNIDDDGLQSALKMLQSLMALDVSGIDTITGEFLSEAPQTLIIVFASGCSLTDKGVRCLAERCPNLETVAISPFSTTLTGQSITVLAENCTKLKCLLLQMDRSSSYEGNAVVFTRHLMALSKLPLLEEIQLDQHADAVTDEVFYELGRHCPLLQSISCVGCVKLTDAACSHLSSCRHLETIDLSRCQGITDEGLIHLSSVRSALKAVHLQRCEGITSAGVGHLLLAQPNLLKLAIKYCIGVSDGVLPMLESSLLRRQCTQPLQIWLHGSMISPEMVSILRERPDVTCYW